MQGPERAYPVSPYRFLIDRSAAKAGSLFTTSALEIRRFVRLLTIRNRWVTYCSDVFR